VNIHYRCCPGYTLYCPDPRDALPGQHVVLIDMDHTVVHEWSVIGHPAVLPGGSVLGSRKPHDDPESTTRGESEQIVQEGWHGQEEWCFTNWDDNGTGTMMARQHHDLQREGNPVGYYAPSQEFVEPGKTLILAHKNKLVREISDIELVDDVIYEVDWSGNLTGFEWHAADHFHELGFDRPAREAIYNGLGRREPADAYDWLHINSLSLLGSNRWYDETGDERFHPTNIIISSRHANFIAIISHATGAIVWRLGPDFTADAPEHNLGQFVGQHHAHMIPRHLPGEGNILVFDNGGRSGYGGTDGFPRYTREYSRVIEFNPVTLEITWQYTAENFFSHFISSAQRLPNGNTLITEGAKGRVFEVTHDKEIVWEFISPTRGKSSNYVYRAYRIPPEWIPGNPAGYTKWAELCQQ